MDVTNAELEVRDLLRALTDAWDRNDAKAYAGLFTPDATYTTFVGTVYHGREDIERSHEALFARFLKGSRMFMQGVSIRFPVPDVALVTCRGDVGKTAPRKLSKVQTFVMVCLDGRWQVAAFHNTKRKPILEWISFRMDQATRPLNDNAAA